MDQIEAELEKKVFFFEEDRDTVRKIVKGTMLNRMLLDAVEEQDAENVKTLLIKLTGFGIIDRINSPIDDKTLDTLLHVSGRLPNQRISSLLVEYGADMHQKNHRGDTPSEFFGMPR